MDVDIASLSVQRPHFEEICSRRIGNRGSQARSRFASNDPLETRHPTLLVVIKTPEPEDRFEVLVILSKLELANGNQRVLLVEAGKRDTEISQVSCSPVPWDPSSKSQYAARARPLTGFGFAILLTEAREESEDLVELLLDACANRLLGGVARLDFLLEIFRALIHGLDQPRPVGVVEAMKGDCTYRLGNFKVFEIGGVDEVFLSTRKDHPEDGITKKDSISVGQSKT